MGQSPLSGKQHAFAFVRRLRRSTHLTLAALLAFPQQPLRVAYASGSSLPCEGFIHALEDVAPTSVSGEGHILLNHLVSSSLLDNARIAAQ
jgi:hypothetical protein